MEKHYFVYILTNYTHTVLYTGVTTDIIKRVWQHKNNVARGFTQKYNVHFLVYFETCTDPQVAIKREKTIKNMLRTKKIALIETMNSSWKDIYTDLIR